MLAKRWILACLATSAWLGGCSPDELAEQEVSIDEAASRLVSGNGTTLNGTSLNGTSLNGTSLNGTSLNGTSLNGVTLSGTVFSGTAGGTYVTGTGFQGAQMTSTLADSTQVQVRLDAIVQSADPDIFLYTVNYWTGSAWASICGYDASNNPIAAIPLTGRWDESAGTTTGGAWINDPNQFTFACVGSTLGKCTTLGYKPWKTVQECAGTDCVERSLQPFHQACTRMIRADYCGDGQTHTHNGVPLNLWDNSGVQSPASVGTSFLNEAEWSANGATCILTVRYNASDTNNYIDSHCPTRRGDTSCFTSSSTFFTANGFSTPINDRSLLRDQYDSSF
jgi:hypothetical protein